MPSYNTITGAGTPPVDDGSYDAELNLIDGPTPPLADPDAYSYEPPNDGIDYPTHQSSSGHSGVQGPRDAGVAPEVSRPIEAGFGKRVDDLLNLSPSLRAMWDLARAQEWNIKLREGDGISEADHTKNPPTIYINPRDVKPDGDTTTRMASLISHEIGHTASPFPHHVRARTREEFVTRATELDMLHEGAAAFANAQARDEISANGGPDIGVRGGFDDKYIAIYESYKAGRITREEAMTQMGAVMANEPMERLSKDTYLTKKQVAERRNGELWDERQHD
jgi:hypothetical protein